MRPVIAFLMVIGATMMACGCASQSTPRPPASSRGGNQTRSPDELMEAQTVAPPMCLDREVMLTIRTDRLQYKVGEAVFLEMRLHNLGRDYKCFYSELIYEGFLVTLDISRDGAPIYRSPPLGVDRTAAMSHYAWIPPGGVLVMYYRGWRPIEPGTYRLGLTYHNEKYEIVLANMQFTPEQVAALGDRAYVPVWTGTATSNIIEIKVTR